MCERDSQTMDANYYHQNGNSSRPQPQYNPVVNYPSPAAAVAATNYQNNGDYMSNYNEYVMYNRQPQQPQQTTNYKQSYDYTNTSNEEGGQFDFYDPYKTYQKQKQLTHSTGYVTDWMHHTTHNTPLEHSSRRLHQKLPTGIPSAVVAPVMRSQQQYYPPQTNNYYQTPHSYVPPYQNVCSQYAPQQPQQHYLTPQSTNLPTTTASDWMAWNLQQQQQQQATIKDLNRNFYHHQQQQQSQPQQQIFDNEASFYYHRNRGNMWPNQQANYNQATTSYYQQPLPPPPSYPQSFHQPLKYNNTADMYAQFNDAFGMHHPHHQASNTSFVQQDQMLVNNGDKLLKSGKPQSLRDFLSTWNEDEEEGQLNLDSFVDQPLTIRPQIHVGITVDSTVGVGTNQFINLPDIIIDIEKPKDKLDDFIVLEEIMQQEDILPLTDSKSSSDQLTHQKIFEEFISSESVSEIVDKMLETPPEKEAPKPKTKKHLLFKRLKNGVKKPKNMMLKMQKKRLRMLKRKCPKSLKKSCVDNLNSKVFRTYFKNVVMKRVSGRKKVNARSDSVIESKIVLGSDQGSTEGVENIESLGSQKDFARNSHLREEEDPPTFSDLIAEHERAVCPLLTGEILDLESGIFSIKGSVDHTKENLKAEMDERKDLDKVFETSPEIVSNQESLNIVNHDPQQFEEKEETLEHPEKISIEDPLKRDSENELSLDEESGKDFEEKKELQRHDLEELFERDSTTVLAYDREGPPRVLEEKSEEPFKENPFVLSSNEDPVENKESPRRAEHNLEDLCKDGSLGRDASIDLSSSEDPEDKEGSPRSSGDNFEEPSKDESLETGASIDLSSNEDPEEKKGSPSHSEEPSKDESLGRDFTIDLSSDKDPEENKKSTDDHFEDPSKEDLQDSKELQKHSKEPCKQDFTIDLTSDHDSVGDPEEKDGSFKYPEENLCEKEDFAKDHEENLEEHCTAKSFGRDSSIGLPSIEDPGRDIEDQENLIYDKDFETNSELILRKSESCEIKSPEKGFEELIDKEPHGIEEDFSFLTSPKSVFSTYSTDSPEYFSHDSSDDEESLSGSLNASKEEPISSSTRSNGFRNVEFLSRSEYDEESPKWRQKDHKKYGDIRDQEPFSSLTERPNESRQNEASTEECEVAHCLKDDYSKDSPEGILEESHEIRNQDQSSTSTERKEVIKTHYSQPSPAPEIYFKSYNEIRQPEHTSNSTEVCGDYPQESPRANQGELKRLEDPVNRNNTFHCDCNCEYMNPTMNHNLTEDFFDDEDEEEPPPPIKFLADSPESPSPENKFPSLRIHLKRYNSEEYIAGEPHFQKKSKYEEERIYMSMCRLEPRVRLKKLTTEEILKLTSPRDGHSKDKLEAHPKKKLEGLKSERLERYLKEIYQKTDFQKKKYEKKLRKKLKKSKKSKKKSKDKESIEAIENFLKLTEHDMLTATVLASTSSAPQLEDEDLKNLLESTSTKSNGIPKLSDLCEHALKTVLIDTRTQLQDENYVVIVLSDDGREEDYNDDNLKCDINENCILKDSNLSKFLEILSNTNSNGDHADGQDDNLFVVIDDEHDFEISHEEEVPDCSSRRKPKTENQLFKKYLYGKYMQNVNTPIRHSNRILKKYRNWRIRSNRGNITYFFSLFLVITMIIGSHL